MEVSHSTPETESGERRAEQIAARAPRRDLPSYGGQAVIEGVMMRGQKAYAIAVRAPDGSIRVRTGDLAPIYRSRIARIPFLRGIIGLWDALVLGIQALTWSANVQAEGAGEEPLEGPALYLSLGTSLALAIGLFFWLPAALGQGLEHYLGWSAFTSNLAEGLIRLVLLVGYIGLIGLLPDVRRLYGYHGAEHKTIHAFEHAAPLTVEGVRPFPEEHPRCGTAFLLILVLLSVLVFALLGPMSLGMRLLTRLALLPVLTGLAYEYLRFTAAHRDHPLVRLLLVPNLALQKLTTRPPDDGMIEVAIAAFQALRQAEEASPAAS